MKEKVISLHMSHIPLLVRAIEITDGAMLDLGMGFSTILMDMMAYPTKRKVVSYESNWDWFQKHKVYESDFHEIKYVKDWSEADIDSQFWSVALVDHDPPRHRKEEVKRLSKNTLLVLLHDTDIYNDHYNRNGVYRMFKYRYDYKNYYPVTSIFSNYIDVSKII